MRHSLRLLGPLFGLFEVATPYARTWYVKPDGTGDAPTIQAAIDSATTGDTVLVAPGLYHENLDMTAKAVALQSESGATETVVDGGARGSVLVMRNGLVNGLTFRDGLAAGGGGVYIASQGNAVLRSNIIEHNVAGAETDAGFGGGVYIEDFGPAPGNVLLESNIIRNNISGNAGGGIFDRGSETRIINNTIAGNAAHHLGGGMVTANHVIGNLIANNYCGNGAAGIATLGAMPALGGATFRGNTIANNVVGQGIPGAAIAAQGQVTISDNVIVYNGPLFLARYSAVVCSNSVLECNDIWGNARDTVDGTENTQSDFSADPEFCAIDPVATLNYLLQEDSPCAPGNDPLGGSCNLIGAVPVGCGMIGVRALAWGDIKQLFR